MASHKRVPCGKVTPARFWVDSLVHDSRALNFLLEVIGEERVILGTDYPFPLGEWHPGELIVSSETLTDITKQRMLADNVFEFLGIPKEDWTKRFTYVPKAVSQKDQEEGEP